MAKLPDPQRVGNAGRRPGRLCLLALALTAAVGGGIVGGAPAAAEAGGVELSLHAGTDGPVVTLLNRGGAPCRAAATALGTVRLTAVSQDGAAVAPQAAPARFPEPVGYVAAAKPVTLQPGASTDLRLQTVAAGPTGSLLESVPPPGVAGSFAWLYPLRTDTATEVVAAYVAPAFARAAGADPPACASTTGTGSLAASTVASTGRVRPWLLAAVGVLAVLLALVLVLVRRRRRVPAVIAGLLVLATLELGVTSPRAEAKVEVVPSLQPIYDYCMAIFRKPGLDPAGVLPVLEAPGVLVQVARPATKGDNHQDGNPFSPTSSFVFWDPDSGTRFHGKQGPETGGFGDPCTNLYHELFHAKEQAQKVNSREKCIIGGKVTAIEIAEVTATRAQNQLRAALVAAKDPYVARYIDILKGKGGPDPFAPREYYGAAPLPTGTCTNAKKPATSAPGGAIVVPGGGDAGDGTGGVDGGGGTGGDAGGGDAGDGGTGGDAGGGDAGDGGTGGDAGGGDAGDGGTGGDAGGGDAGDGGTGGDAGGGDAGDGGTGSGDGGSDGGAGGDGGPNVGGEPGGGGGGGGAGSGGCSRGCGRSTGDPHLVTIDQRPYSFQAVGEFVLTRDPRGGYEIQARQVPIEPPGAADVSVTSAVAMTVGEQRVELRLGGTALTLLVDGAPRALADVSLRAGASVRVSTGAYAQPVVTVRWPDTSLAEVSAVGRGGIAVQVDPAEGRRGRLEGLLGNADGKSDGDVRMRGGDPLPDTTYEQLYPRFADSWRVDRPTSLFTYDAGTGPETYADRTFPRRPTPPLAELPGAAAAEAVCRQWGVTDPVALAGCVLDVAVTGEADYAVAAFTSAQPRPGVVRVDGPVVPVAVTQPQAAARLAFEGRAGQAVYVRVDEATLPDACGVLHLLDPGGTEIAGGCVIGGAGRIDATALPLDGTYTLVVDPDGDATGTAKLRLTTVTPGSAALPVDGPSVALTIGTAGGTQRLTFDGRKDQSVYVRVSGATVPDQCGILHLLGPDAKEINSGCIIGGTGRIDATRLPRDGTYTVLVDPNGDATGRLDLAVTTVAEAHGTIEVDGPPVTVAVTTPGSTPALTFTGAEGAIVYVRVTGSTLPDECGLVILQQANGAAVSSGCSIAGNGRIDATRLPRTGTYTLLVDPDDERTGTATLALTAVTDQEGRIAVGGPPVVARIAEAGAVSRFAFDGRRGQRVEVAMSDGTLPDECALVQIQDARGRDLADGCMLGGVGRVGPLALPADAAYTVVVDADDERTGAVTLRLAD